MLIIRPTQPDDEPFLWDMGWEATAVDAGMRALGRDAALAMPHVRRYLNDWGRPGDAGVVAVSENGQRLGAAWYRLFPVEDPGWGFVAADVPELSIGVVAEARGRGVGSRGTGRSACRWTGRTRLVGSTNAWASATPAYPTRPTPR